MTRFENDQRMVGVFLQPTRQVIRFPKTAIIEPVIAIIELREVVQLEGIDIREPLAIGSECAGVAQFNAHRSCVCGHLHQVS